MRRVGFAALAIALTGGCAVAGAWLNLSAAKAGSVPAVAGLALPKMDSGRGRVLYVSKGCVVCHAINGAGGADAAPLDAASMDPALNPFEFFARMWVGTKPMIAMQEERMGQQVEFTAEELGDIVAFIHDPVMQKSFSEKEIPEAIEHLIE